MSIGISIDTVFACRYVLATVNRKKVDRLILRASGYRFCAFERSETKSKAVSTSELPTILGVFAKRQEGRNVQPLSVVQHHIAAPQTETLMTAVVDDNRLG